MPAVRTSPRLLAALSLAAVCCGQRPPQLSGVYPHLAVYNQENECGIGAVVPWAERLWVITYAPHRPNGSTDKLYEIDADLALTIRPESVGGTPASRLVHAESGQLFVGPYAIGRDRAVRVIPPARMPGRLTAAARHLTAPGKVVIATMEEGLYEVDAATLEVTELWADAQPGRSGGGRTADLPGYHGKGLYSGQGVYVYANNGEYGERARTRPDTPSGALAEWDGVADAWTVVRRNQFTEVTGPGGIGGDGDPATDPIWAVGWDHRSLLLGVRRAAARDGSHWRFFRLPKSSHAYDGAHGWNTEWPRIRDIGERDLLMTMHGAFWRFPRDLGAGAWTGVAPRSNYLKVVGDFCRWNDRVVLGCDDTARSGFLNERRAKGRIAPAQSHSNLWFLEPGQLDELGPVIGRGAVFVGDDVAAGAASDPFLFAGYDLRGLHLSHVGDAAVRIVVEVGDGADDGEWEPLAELSVPARGYRFVRLTHRTPRAWIRVRPLDAARSLTAAFVYRDVDLRGTSPAPAFAGLARPGQASTGGLLRARGGDERTLSLLARGPDGAEVGYYELGADLALRRVDDEAARAFTREHAAIPRDVLVVDRASVLFVDDAGRRWRLPKGDAAFDAHPLGDYRVDREVVTERDLFHAHGTFYELPADNAGGFAKVRPIATSDLLVHDYCGYRGLLVMTGVAADAAADDPHVLRSADGAAAVWAGAIDDLWRLGKPRGRGGPWRDAAVVAGRPSDPYLMTGYDEKELTLVADRACEVAVEVDVTGDGAWCEWRRLPLLADQPLTHVFAREFSAYWIRFRADVDCTASAQLVYR